MSVWRTDIRCYISPGNNNKIEDWYKALSAQGRADADVFIAVMRKTTEWRMPDYRPHLQGTKGLGELRWKSENRAHRLLGFFMKGSWYAVVGCIHKGKVYNPSDSLETAGRYKARIERGQVETVEYDL
jgi:hypothetical protein